MKKIINAKRYILIVAFLASCFFGCEQKKDAGSTKSSEYPRLLLTNKSISEIRNNLGKVPLFDNTLEQAKIEIDAILDQPIDVPVPKDMAGGYTHEQHKGNFFIIQKAGALYQITGDVKYAEYVRDMLMAYAKLVPTIGIHPQPRSYARGKLFWQCLNDANWLVYTSQAYDCVYDFLTEEERNIIEKDALRPIVDHISIESPQFFNRIHNHSTWGIAGVGMMGIVMQDEELIDRAMNGLKTDNISADQKDNDGGFIKPEGVEKLGFLAQIDNMFSPSGYYTEGPYYQRYAMSPFMMFAVAIENNMPEQKIFAYRDSVLVKAVNALINLSDANGEFFPLNDAQKGMSYMSRELVAAVDIVYQYGGQSSELLSVAQEQGQVLLDNSGMAVARDIANGKAKKFRKVSVELLDGSDGSKGAIGILRSDEIELVMKYSSQGEGHGHFDKLSFSLYNDGEEIMQDYGLARYVNIEQKNGGGYLKENTTWAKQTIAHNTIVVNETSHFKGRFRIGNKYHSEGYLFDTSDENIQVVSAKEENAYPGVNMHRTMAVIRDESFEHPIVLDLFRVTSDDQNQYDLPYYVNGHTMSSNVEVAKLDVLNTLGSSHGYQHLWIESEGELKEKNLKLAWLGNETFYSLTSAISDNIDVLFTILGANDTERNLRRDQGIILRMKGKKDALFASLIEIHGGYNPVTENASNAFSSIKEISITKNDEDYTLIDFESLSGLKWIFAISNNDVSKSSKHELTIENKKIDWEGPYYFTKQ